MNELADSPTLHRYSISAFIVYFIGINVSLQQTIFYNTLLNNIVAHVVLFNKKSVYIHFNKKTHSFLFHFNKGLVKFYEYFISSHDLSSKSYQNNSS